MKTEMKKYRIKERIIEVDTCDINDKFMIILNEDGTGTPISITELETNYEPIPEPSSDFETKKQEFIDMFAQYPEDGFHLVDNRKLFESSLHNLLSLRNTLPNDEEIEKYGHEYVNEDYKGMNPEVWAEEMSGEFKKITNFAKWMRSKFTGE